MKFHLNVLIILFGIIPILSAGQSWCVKSPDEKVSVILSCNAQGQLLYHVPGPAESSDFIQPSRLGIVRTDGAFADSLTFLFASPVQMIEASYTMLTGKHSRCHYACHEQTFWFANTSNQKIGVTFRVFDEGAAFRYVFEGRRDQISRILEEFTEFSVSPDGYAWMQEYDWWSPPYERLYQNKIRIGKVSPRHREDGWSYPALFQVGDSWMLITEAGLDDTYCATHIRNAEDSPVYKICLATKEMGYEAGAVHPQITLPWQSPWRVLILGDLKTIVESSLVHHLSPPSRLKETDWIRPGRSTWSWLYEPASPRDYNALKRYVDLSAELNWEYTLADANWNEMRGGSLEQLAGYAESRDVRLFVWYNSGGIHNQVTEAPRDRLNDPAIRRKEFAWLQSLNVAGIKVDFFNSDKQDIIKLYLDILKDAADYELLVNFHGCTLPRGWARTWPNLMTMEAVKGAEWYLGAEEEFIYQAGRHNAILPFTRNVVGSMDYTPVNFSANKLTHITSYAHELALSIVFESGVLHSGDTPESFAALPEKVRSFLRDVPTAWDETRFIAGYPGKYAVIARRKHNVWTIGGINGYFEEQLCQIDLNDWNTGTSKFLLIRDGENKESFETECIEISGTKPWRFSIPSEGGFVMVSQED